jgi:F-type H+-transporting ATPase subunit delta
MIKNPLAARIAVPYARAFLDFAINKNIMHQITADFQNLETFLNENPELTGYLNNVLVSREAKHEILAKILKSQINAETLKFLMLLVDKDRINILSSVITGYLELVYQTASIKLIQVSTAFAFTSSQKDALIQKLKELTKAREIRLLIEVDPNLIGGFFIKTDSKVIDFTIKNQLQKLAQHLDTALEIQF